MATATKEKVQAEKANGRLAISKPEIETVKDTVQVTFAKRDFMENCPVDEKTVQKLEQYQHEYIEAITDKTVDIAIEQFKKSDDVKGVVANAPYMTQDTLSLNIDRTIERDGKEQPQIIVATEQSNGFTELLSALEKKIGDAI